MKNINLVSLMLVAMALSSCQVIGGIFKAGVLVGVLAVIVVVAIIIWLIAKFTGK